MINKFPLFSPPSKARSKIFASIIGAASLTLSANAADVLLVTDAGPPASATGIGNLLESGGHTVTMFDFGTYGWNLGSANGVDFANNFDLVVVSRNVNYGGIRGHGATWNSLTVPMINLNMYLVSGQFVSASWAWAGGSTLTGGNPDGVALTVGDAADPIFTDITLTGGDTLTPDLYSANARYWDIDGGTPVTGVTVLARNPSDADRIAIAYAAPNSLRAGGAAQYYIAGANGETDDNVFNAEGEKLFFNAINILTGGVVVAVPLELNITGNTETTGSFDFQWTSNAGRAYDLVSSTDLSTAPDTWGVWENNANILASETGLNTLTAVAAGDSKRFFAIVEKDPPIQIE